MIKLPQTLTSFDHKSNQGHFDKISKKKLFKLNHVFWLHGEGREDEELFSFFQFFYFLTTFFKFIYTSVSHFLVFCIDIIFYFFLNFKC